MSSLGDRTTRSVTGALQSAINEHGPITSKNLPSAVKRIVAQLRSAAENASLILPDSNPDGLLRAAVDAANKRTQKLRHGHEMLIERHRRLRDHADAHRDDAARLAEILDLALCYVVVPDNLRYSFDQAVGSAVNQHRAITAEQCGMT